MWLTRVSIKNPYLAAVLMMALTLLGLFSWNKIAIEEFPEIRFPVAVVTTAYPGASPEVVESEVSRPLEEALNTINGIEHIRSYSVEGASTIVVEFNLTVNQLKAMQEVRDKVASVQGRFNRDIRTPSISQANPNDDPILSFVFSSKLATSRQLSNWIDNVLKPKLQTVEGVGDVDIVGESKREILIDLVPERLEAYQLSVPQVATTIEAANKDFPAGSVTVGHKELSLRIAGKLKTPENFANIIVADRNGGLIRLSDIAVVKDAEAERKSITLIDGRLGIGLSIQATRGANVVEMAKGVKAAMDQLKPTMPPGTTMITSYDKSKEVKRSLDDVETTLLEGALLTVLIVFLFLGSWRSTVITGLTLPISMIGTLFALFVMGFTLNMMTLMALSLSVGLLIDDAIVVRENIVRHTMMGKTHFQAALDGTNEIGLAVLATTLTIVAVFLPIGFMQGVIGQFFHQFGLTVTVAVLISLLVSFTLDPMLSSIWYDPDAEGKRTGWMGWVFGKFNTGLDKVTQFYVKLIHLALNFKKTVLLLAALSLVGSFMLVPVIGGEFMPKTDRAKFRIVLETAPGSDLNYTTEKALQVERIVQSMPDIRSIETKVGGGRFGANASTAVINVTVSPKSERKQSVFELIAKARRLASEVAGVKVKSVRPLGQNGGGGKPVNIGVRGNNLKELQAAADQITQRLKQIKGLEDVESSLSVVIPTVDVKVDRDAASGLGVSLADVGQTLSTLIGGDKVTTWEAPDGENYDVRLQVPKIDRQESLLDELKITAKNADGQLDSVPLSAVTQFAPSNAPRQIDRVDLMREITITAGVEDNASKSAVFEKVNKLTQTISLPAGVYLSQEGEQKDMMESLSYALQALGMGVAFIYMILAAQFRSFTLPLTIMVALPLSFVGVFVALWLCGATLNIFSVIGIVMLMGLASKNGILLVDFINHKRQLGESREQAIVEAGQVRLRPILMTSLAMIFGMLPLALALGEGSESQRPMAQAIIGGMLTSTVLTLVVLPVVYTYMDDLRSLIHRLLKKGRPVKA